MRKGTIRAMSGNVLGAALLWTWSLLLTMPATAPLYAQASRSVTTVQYNNARTGWNADETTLNVNNVNPTSFGRKWSKRLVGQIYGGPLYVRGVNIGGQLRNVVYVATESNLIYALDADNNGAELWVNSSLGTPGRRNQLGCGNISPNVGITSTPVIDLLAEGTGTLYAVGLTEDGPVFKMAAVDIATGASRLGWPVTVRPPDAVFNVPRTSQRGALLLANGLVYVGFGGYFGDCRPYHGWVVGVDKTDPTTPQIYYRTPGTDPPGSHHGSGIWAAGGLAGDENGNIYASTGNSFSAPLGRVDFSNAVIRLAPDLTFSEADADYFMPTNWRTLNTTDRDLGSSAPLLIPEQVGSNTPNMAFIMGKFGVGHLLNRDYLGGVGGEIYSETAYGSAFSTAAYYKDDTTGPVILLAGRGTQTTCGTSGGVAILALDLDAEGNSYYYTADCVASGTALSPVVTSAPGQAGILWVLNSSGTLLAFNIATREELYRDALGATRALGHFTVVDGKVFAVNSANDVIAYGLR